MGRDKALLPYGQTTLLDHVARTVLEAAGDVELIGDPAKYGGLGYRIHSDQIPGCGPLSGLYTALRVTRSDWNLVVACDMPGISAAILCSLLEAAPESGADCVAAEGSPGRPEPLCAVYHRRCLPAVSRAMHDKRLKMHDLIEELELRVVPVASSAIANVNTPADWADLEETLKK